MKSFKLTSQQVHQVEDQALNDTYSDTHLTHQSQVPGKQATKIHAEILRGKKSIILENIFSHQSQVL